MRSVTALIPFCLVLMGCTAGADAPSACEVISPPSVMVPSDQNRERVDSQSSSDPMPERKPTNCP